MFDADPSAAAPIAGRIIGLQGPEGDAASSESIKRLSKKVASTRTQRKALEHVRAALIAVRDQDFQTADRRALKALEVDETLGLAWHVLAISREKAGHFIQAIQAYNAALKCLDDENEVAHDLARLAQRLGYNDIAEKLQRRFLAANPGHLEATNNLASLLREERRYDEAVDTLRPLIEIEPDHPLLWNTLGSVLSDQGRMKESLVFFDEALRLQPDFAKARFNRGGAYHSLGRGEDARQDMKAALPGAEPGYERAMMEMALGMTLLSLGDLSGGMALYESRLSPDMPEAPYYVVNAPRWKPAEDDIRGKRLLVAGEQGLADEMLFANVMQDVIDAVGPDGKVYIAVERRLVSLFQRSFPQAHVGAHVTVTQEGNLRRYMPFLESAPDGPPDYWAPIGALTGVYRTSLEAFPERSGHLVPDPERVAHWKAELEKLGPGLKVGLHWKSLVLTGARVRYFSTFERWKPVLTAPGCVMINLQCGDVEEDLKAVKAAGVEIWTPPFNLKDDMEELAAISKAVDVVIGPGIAGTNMAAAVGARTWMATAPDDWHLLGTQRYPFYPQMVCFPLGGYDGWPETLERMREALGRAVEGEWPSN